MKIDLFEIFIATIGTMGFTFVFNIKKNRVIPAGIGGMIGWTAYLISNSYYNNPFTSNMIATFIICIYAEICARKLKAPANIFLVPSMFPLIPGSGLYYTMQALVTSDNIMARKYGLITVGAILGIVAGMILGTSFFYSVVLVIKEKIDKFKNEKIK